MKWSNRKFVTSVIKPPGRPLSLITNEFYITEPTETMLILTELKNGGHSWRDLAAMLGNSTSPALLWKVTKGLCQSEVVDAALGVIPLTVKVIPCKCGEAHLQKTCPKDRAKAAKRPRVWLRIDNLEKARETIEKYYPHVTVMARDSQEGGRVGQDCELPQKAKRSWRC